MFLNNGTMCLIIALIESMSYFGKFGAKLVEKGPDIPVMFFFVKLSIAIMKFID